MKKYILLYQNCDKILNALAEDSHHRITETHIYSFFERKDHPPVRAAMQELIKSGYIKPDPHPYYVLLGEGAQIQSNGGFEKEFERLNQEEEFNKMHKWYDSENAKTTFEDYPNVSKRSKWALGLSIAALILEVLKWITQK